MSAVRATQDRPTLTSLRVLCYKLPTMYFITKLKKKSKSKKAKTIKKKLVTASEIFLAGGLLTAGGNLVDSITGEDSSSTQISAGEVNWVNDQTRSLFEIKTNQRDTTSAFPWGILGYILLGLGMTLLAIPAIRLLRWIRVSCMGGKWQHPWGQGDRGTSHHEGRGEISSWARGKTRVWLLPVQAKLVTKTADARAGNTSEQQHACYVISLVTSPYCGIKTCIVYNAISIYFIFNNIP